MSGDPEKETGDDMDLMEYFRNNMKEFKAWRDEHEGSDDEWKEIKKELLGTHRAKKSSSPESIDPSKTKSPTEKSPSKDGAAGQKVPPKPKRWI